MFTSTLTIGRTFGDSAHHAIRGQVMSSQLWADFSDEVNEVAARVAQAIESAGWLSYVSKFEGVSHWAGNVEDSIIFQVLTPIAVDEASIEIYELYLVELADTYGQDCIAAIWNAEATLVHSPNHSAAFTI